MGFSAVLYSYPIYKAYTYKDYKNMEDYFSYFNSEWAQKTFGSIDNYLKETNTTEIGEDAFLFFNQAFPQVASESVKYHNVIGDWTSNGSAFFDVIKDIYGLSDDYYIELSKEKLIELLYNIWDIFQRKYKLEPTTIKNCYRINNENEITIIPCDGIEITDSNCRLQRINSNEEECGVMVNYDGWLYSGFLNTIDILVKALYTVDFNKEKLFYVGSF